MALTAFILELVALWFQHVMLLQPCVLCVMNALRLFGVGAGLVGAIAPKPVAKMRRAADLAVQRPARSVKLAWEHTMIQLHPSPFGPFCDFAARFPDVAAAG